MIDREMECPVTDSAKQRWMKTIQPWHPSTGTGKVELAFGYVPPSVWAVIEYQPGIMVGIGDEGKWFTVIGNDQYTGTFAEVEHALWEKYARHEVAATSGKSQSGGEA